MEASAAVSHLQAAVRGAPPRVATPFSLTYQGETLGLFVLRGADAGPTVWIEGALHGDEGYGAAACLQLAGELGAKLTAGTVILCPVVNPTAFAAMTNPSPHDGINLNRAGNMTGDSYSVRYFDWLVEVICASADVVIDLHGGGNFLAVQPFAMIPASDDAIFAEALRLVGGTIPYVVGLAGTKGTLVEAAHERGKVAMLLESGSGSIFTQGDVDAHKNSVAGVLAALGMSDTVAVQSEAEPVVLRHEHDLYFETGGVIAGYAPPGTVLDAGDAIVSLYTGGARPEPVVVSPAPGAVLLAVRASPRVHAAEYAAYVAHK